MMNKKYLIIIFVLFILISFFGSGIINLITDWYWFNSVNYESIFTTILSTQIILGIIVGILTFALLGMSLFLVHRFARSSPYGHTAHTFGILGSLVIALLAGIVASGSWETVLQYFNAVDFNEVDPIFSRDISFYMFELPFIEFILSFVLLLIIISFIGSIISYGIRGSLPLQQFKVSLIDKPARNHLLVLISLFFVVLFLRIYFVRIPSLVYSTTGPLIGASYTDIHAILPSLKILSIVALGIAVFAILNIVTNKPQSIIFAIIFYILVSVIGVWAYPTLLQKLVVLPNELVKETPYLQYHIDATQKAFGLDSVVERNLTGETTLDMDDINNNQSTIQNIRLWDREPLLDTFSQIQEIRTYYDFVSVDNDRYRLNGDYRQVLLSPRELNSSSLPQRNFINEHLTFTHGFGLTLGPVNEVTPEGLPLLLIKDLPPTSSIESLTINRPEIYYGELSNEYVVVNTDAKEFDYPSGDENVFTSYSGNGGIEIGSVIRKALFAFRFGTLKILLSNDIGNDSKIMYYRDIQSRVKRVLPFLRFDADPYLVVDNEGRLKWIYDAYTTSNRYPYAQMITERVYSQYEGFQPYIVSQLNYIRNSVKVVIDAYDGSMTFYIADSNDPIIQVYSKIFNGSFMPLDEMDEYLQTHIRYPEDLFEYQTKLYTIYHMGDPQIFYNKEDQWEIPTKAATGRGDPMMRHMIMKLPEEQTEEFILMIPFTPRGKDNLASWMVARNDGEYYGQLMVYRFPKQKLVFGPTQIINRINQDTEISSQLTLWDQRGSQVIRGNLFVIPIEKSLLYIQPIYLRAEGGRIPELKRVIVAYENKIAMEERLDRALERIFSGTLEIKAQETILEVELPKIQEEQDLIKTAQEHYENALDAQRRGDWATYGEEIKKLGEILQQL
ncbi:UPF0182 family protein [Patescibacteria group bacterium AH-259-L05]|nr:UPF0182 family protein [Patescibacteria group bacterium AH-259-L05]